MITLLLVAALGWVGYGMTHVANNRFRAKLNRLRELYDPKRISLVTGLTGGYNPGDDERVHDYIEDRTSRTRELLGIDSPVRSAKRKVAEQ